MAQIFHRSTNTIARFTIFGALFVVVALIAFVGLLNESAWVTGVHVAREQPIQFSHQRHVAGNGLDCRYCHTAVETSPFAGIPPTATCMNCHREIYSSSPYLEPIRASYRTGEPLRWIRVHDLPGYAYFNHSIHIHKGIGCTTCHGAIDTMPLVWQDANLQMEWCLDCHRNPERYVRPRDQVFSVSYRQPSDQLALGRRLVEDYQIQRLTSCDTCHR